MPRLLAAVCFALLFTSNTQAEKNMEIPSALLKSSELVVEDSFEKELGKKFVAAKGEWNVVDGVLVGKELKSDNHAAVLNYQRPNRDSRIQFSFLLDGVNGFNLSFNHAKGHLFRVIVAKDSLAIRTDKDKKDPKSKPILLDQVKGKVSSGEWHTLSVEVLGEKVHAQLDNGMTSVGSHPSLATKKPNYRFVIKGESLKIDDLKIWESKK